MTWSPSFAHCRHSLVWSSLGHAADSDREQFTSGANDDRLSVPFSQSLVKGDNTMSQPNQTDRDKTLPDQLKENSVQHGARTVCSGASKLEASLPRASTVIGTARPSASNMSERAARQSS
jgi:hypothetical protein